MAEKRCQGSRQEMKRYQLAPSQQGRVLDDGAFAAFLDHRGLQYGDDSLHGNQHSRQRRGPQ